MLCRTSASEEIHLPIGAEEIAAARAAAAIVQIAQKQGWLDRLWDLFRIKHPVIVLGSTGTGKSNFIESLRSLVPKAIDSLNRTSEAQIKRVRLAGSIFDFVDTPGQGAHKSRRMSAVQQILNEEQFGVINVVSYGYHEYRTGRAEALTDDGQVRPEWLRHHQEIEIVAAAEWAPLMTARPAYSITLVTKADLWWPQRDEVLAHYESGRYFATIRDAVIHGHTAIPYSSVNHLFYQSSTSGRFSDEDRADCQQVLLKELFLSVASEL
jgi:50S ribosome-binding GTPase